VLDFGCGAGRVVRHFADEAAVATFVGCDIDEPSIEWARANLSPPFSFFVNEEAPPLAQPDASFDLVYAFSVFTHITDEWSGWLLELHRILSEGGLLVVSVLGGAMSESAAGEPWYPDRIGMNVLDRSQPWSAGGPTVLLSEWWLRAHWGRIFDVVLYQPGAEPGQQDLVLLRRRPVEATREELERSEPREPRELAALMHNVRQLHRESAILREELAQLRGSALWRLTAPVRAAGRRLRSRSR
jgi:SAM-dependent methyltransferase